MKAMEHDTSGYLWSFFGGSVAGVLYYILKIDWTTFWQGLGPDSIKAVIVGILGGAGGLLGKKLIERFFFKNKRKKHVDKL